MAIPAVFPEAKNTSSLINGYETIKAT